MIEFNNDFFENNLEAEKLIIEYYKSCLTYNEFFEMTDFDFNKQLNFLISSNKIFEQQRTYILIAKLYFEKALQEDGTDYFSLIENKCSSWENPNNDKIHKALYYLNESKNPKSRRFLYEDKDCSYSILSANIQFYLKNFKESIFLLIGAVDFFKKKYHYNFYKSSPPLKICEESLYINLVTAMYKLLKELTNGKNLEELSLDKKNGFLIQDYIIPDWYKDEDISGDYIWSNTTYVDKNTPSDYISFIELIIIGMTQLQKLIKNTFYSEDYAVQKYDKENFPLYKMLGDYYFLNKKYQLAYNQYALARQAYFFGFFDNTNHFLSETNSWDWLPSEVPSTMPLDFITNDKIDFFRDIIDQMNECEKKIL